MNESRWDKLDKKIQKKRKEMIEEGLSKGFNDKSTILKSQQMDKLIYEIQKLEKKS
ncbi:aspartyl-phosphate phosphatase Spo0E family protein [Gracilibacillus sp. YIM 98692]|uniref:aspartyl-phosphate phosphatase Spo0E family protein n=1 Tax=Gracilibacillus sp. YIM 98692 TaxID=2663532 RepID=UPI001F09EA7E|nr:aspartyl-phosphate phosphatase Spo0E family protein [Gracilibacillus sp. YIM 98692]